MIVQRDARKVAVQQVWRIISSSGVQKDLDDAYLQETHKKKDFCEFICKGYLFGILFSCVWEGLVSILWMFGLKVAVAREAIWSLLS